MRIAPPAVNHRIVAVVYNPTLQQTSRPLLSKFSERRQISAFDPHFEEVRFEEVRGWRKTLVDGSLESSCRVIINCNWNFFFYLLSLTRYKGNVSKLTALRRGWVSLSQDFRGKGSSLGNIFWFLENYRHILLSDSANGTVLRAVVLTQYRRVTDGWTDGRNCHS